MTKKIILISDPRILKVLIRGNKEPLVDLRKFPNFFFDNRNESKTFSLIRKSVADKLLEAQKYLPSKICFLIIEGYRSISLQREYFKEHFEDLKKKYPKWENNKTYLETTKYVAPPNIIPPHTTGGAIDLTLVTNKNKELNMGTPLNASPSETRKTCFTNATNISKISKKNRKILINAMSKAGFVNYPTEWWHWSYGDRYWAYFKKQKYSFYDKI